MGADTMSEGGEISQSPDLAAHARASVSAYLRIQTTPGAQQ
jgi:hypothetical protein